MFQNLAVYRRVNGVLTSCGWSFPISGGVGSRFQYNGTWYTIVQVEDDKVVVE